MNPEVAQSAYVFALSQVEGLGSRSLLRILKVFPQPDSLVEASSELIHGKLGEELSRIVLIRFLGHWEKAISSAQEVILQHHEVGVVPVPITDDKYPPLLKLIPDPPPLLFVRGNLEALSLADTVAVVGTRNATDRGKEVASRIAKYFGKSGYVVVSGLAKGIDTAAHKGALEAGAKTVAVLGTALDQIYPAENRPLAERIASDSGALITELPLGKKSFKNTFVQRDRIQSGMSLAVVPVQSDITGGTMHTVKFAEAQNRLLLCPKPIANEKGLKQYAGILELIRTQRAREFQAEDYESLLTLLQEQKQKLLSVKAAKPVEAAPKLQIAASKDKQAVVRARRQRKKALAKHQTVLGFVEPEPVTKRALNDQEIEKLVAAVSQLGLDSSADRLDKTVAELRKLRKKLFGEKRPKHPTSQSS